MKILKKIILYILCKGIYRVENIGIENIDSTTSNLLVANHTSSLDGILLWACVENISIMAKKEIFKNKLLARLLLKAGVFPIARGEKDVKSIYHAVNLLRGKTLKNLLIFPEGTRNAKKRGIKAKTGAAYLAISTNVKIVPIYIEERKKMFKRNKIIYGKPFVLDVAKQEIKNREMLRKQTDLLMEKIYSLKGTKRNETGIS